jgi:predicted amidophosphoribosyltransferase
MVKVVARSEYRTEAKKLEGSDRARILDGEFTVTQRLDGQRVLIADDVFRSGMSMSAVAAAARDAGALRIYGICGVRTMRR